MQTRALVAMGWLVAACGPLPPVGGSGEATEGGGSTSGEPTSGAPTTTEPGTSSGSASESGSTTEPPPECVNDGDCSFGECSYCIEGVCESFPGCCGLMPGPGGDLQFRCIGYECYSDDECGDGEVCELAPGFCESIPAIPTCETQMLALSSLSLQGVPSAVALLDVDGDAALDLVATLPQEGMVEVALGDGAGGFAPGATFPSKLEPGAHRIAWADFDGDGDLDLAIARPVPVGELSLLFGQDAGFAEAVLLNLGATPGEVWAGDVDGDGSADLLAHNLEGPAPLALRLGDGLGGFGPELGGDQLVGKNFVAAAGDVGDDGLLEVVTSAASGAGIEVWSFKDGQFVSIVPQAVHGTITQEALVVGAIGGDPTGDVAAVRSVPLGGLVTTWTSPGLVPSERAVEGAVQLGPIADVDGDGGGDLVTLAADPSLLRVIYTGGEGCVQSFALPGASAPELLAAGDVDGDGEADVLAGSFAGPEVALLRSGP